MPITPFCESLQAETGLVHLPPEPTDAKAYSKLADTHY